MKTIDHQAIPVVNFRPGEVIPLLDLKAQYANLTSNQAGRLDALAVGGFEPGEAEDDPGRLPQHLLAVQPRCGGLR